MLNILPRLLVAIAIFVVAILGVLELIEVRRGGVSREELMADFSGFFTEDVCEVGGGKPEFVDRGGRRSMVLECETSLPLGEVIHAYSKKMREREYVVLFDGIGRDGIASVRGCSRGVVFTIYAAKVDGDGIVERRVTWDNAEYKRLPKKCKFLR